MSESGVRKYNWHYANLRYAFAEGIGVHGSFSVDVAGRIEGERVLWVEIVISSQSGNFGTLLPSGQVRLLVDGQEVRAQLLGAATSSRRETKTFISQANPLRRPVYQPDETQVFFYPDRFEFPGLVEYSMTPVETQMTPVDDKTLCEARITARKRRVVLEVKVDLQVYLQDGSGSVPAMPPSLSAKQLVIQ